MQLRQCILNQKIRDFVLSDSEIPLLIIAKLTYYFVQLPEQLPLPKKVVGPTPATDDSVSAGMNLYD